jgi:large subunit ribosomal protein L6
VSRIGRAPIPIPAGVQISIQDGTVTVKGPKGELSRALPPYVSVHINDGVVTVTRPTDSSLHRSLHGLTRSLVDNMVVGVTKGFERRLEVRGVGYRVQKAGDRLVLQLGFSHPIELLPPKGVEIAAIETFTPTAANEWLSGRFSVRGIDKEMVGQLAANIRAIRAVEPYKGKGIKYTEERVRRKAGKAAGKAKGGK